MTEPDGNQDQNLPENEKQHATLVTEKLIDRVKRITEDLNQLEPAEHGTVVSMLQQLFNLRAMQYKQARDAEEAIAKAEIDRANRFGLNDRAPAAK